MKSARRGSDTLEAEVEAISRDGLWILMDQEEFFLSFEDFPWFRDASVSGILHLERPRENHLYWPTLDVDLDVDSIRDPRRYPLVSRERPTPRAGRIGKKSARRSGKSRPRVKR